jgi:uncharacterized protein YeaO (DUF488 family)
VDRLWPCGAKKKKMAFDVWLRDPLSSDALRKWFGLDPELSAFWGASH